MESFEIAKNDTPNLHLIFYKKGLTSIHKPLISHFEISDSKKINPAFSIGFKEPMGYTQAFSVTAGRVVFEVLKGFPLQSLMAFLSTKGDPVYRLQDLPPIDFICLSKDGTDKYGEFIVKNVKFQNVQIKQGVQSPGRYLVADFMGTSLHRFSLPYFYNEFISDNYENHLIRSSKEIANIKLDVESFSKETKLFTPAFSNECVSLLMSNRTDTFSPFNTISSTLDFKEAELMQYEKDGDADAFQKCRIEIRNFIKRFYQEKNAFEEVIISNIKVNTYKDEDFIFEKEEDKTDGSLIVKGV